MAFFVPVWLKDPVTQFFMVIIINMMLKLRFITIIGSKKNYMYYKYITELNISCKLRKVIRNLFSIKFLGFKIVFIACAV
jgi:hypothetical protein